MQMILASGLVAAVPNAGISAGLRPGHGLEHYDDLTDTQQGAHSYSADEDPSKATDDGTAPYRPFRYRTAQPAEPDGPINDAEPVWRPEGYTAGRSIDGGLGRDGHPGPDPAPERP